MKEKIQKLAELIELQTREVYLNKGYLKSIDDTESVHERNLQVKVIPVRNIQKSMLVLLVSIWLPKMVKSLE